MDARRFGIGIACATIGATLWGLSGVCAQYLYEHALIDASFITFVRATVAAVIFAFILFIRYRPQCREILSSRELVAKHLVFGALMFGSQLFYLLSIRYTNAGTATVLQMSNLIFILIVTTIRTRRAPSPREILGFLCALVGTWLIVTQGDWGVIVIPVLGLIYGLLNGASAAGYIMYPRALFARFGTMVSIGVAMIAEVVLAFSYWAFDQATSGSPRAFDLPSLDPFGILVLVGGVGVIGTFAAFFLYLHGCALIGSVKGGLLGAFEPIGAMVISAFWLGTSFTAYDWIGFLLMLTMLVLVTVPSKEQSLSSNPDRN